MDIIDVVTFDKWLWGKFDDWRRGTTRGVTEFALYLDVSQPSMTRWLKGELSPSSKSIKKIAERYPDVYEAFGGNVDLSPNGVPLELTYEVKNLFIEIREAIEKSGFEPESPEALIIANDILDRFVSNRRSKR
jgi:hypothetical protein